ncbi:MAG: hypothetical protein R3Y65_06740 [Bacillota bacterium]
MTTENKTSEIEEKVKAAVKNLKFKLDYDKKEYNQRIAPLYYLERAEWLLDRYKADKERLELCYLNGGKNCGFPPCEFEAVKADIFYLEKLKRTTLKKYADVINELYLNEKSKKQFANEYGIGQDSVTQLYRMLIISYAEELVMRDISYKVPVFQDRLLTQEICDKYKEEIALLRGDKKGVVALIESGGITYKDFVLQTAVYYSYFQIEKVKNVVSEPKKERVKKGEVVNTGSEENCS